MRIRLVVALETAALVALAVFGHLHAVTVVVSGQSTGTAPAPHASSEQAADMAEILTLDQKIGTAVVRGDTAYVASMTSSDFIMVHGDGWTTGGQPLNTDTEDSMLRRVASK